jgi:hypothetical protein
VSHALELSVAAAPSGRREIFASLPTVIKANAARCFRSEKEK